MSNTGQQNKKKKPIADYMPEERERMREELLLILRKCADGTATEKEKRIGNRLNTYILINDIRSTEENAEVPVGADRSEKEDRIWKNISLNYGFNENTGLEELVRIPGKRNRMAAWQNVKKQPEKTTAMSRMNGFRRYAAIAAMLTVIFCSAAYFAANRFLVQEPTVYQTAGITEEAILPDGTDVRLNQGSVLTIADSYNRNAREVSMEGQIFFDVAKDPDKPFIIRHGELTTKVHGTSFDIKCYPELNENVVTVRTGLVEVRRGTELLAMLTPGKKLNYSILTGNYEVKDITWDETVGWLDGRIILDHADINELKLQIKQRFNKELVVTEQAFDGDVRLYSSFNKDATLEQVMERLGILYGVKFTTDSSRVIVYR